MKLQILILFITVLISGCAIIPQTTDIPLIREKGDLRIDAGVSLIPTANATVSYGLSEKIAVQAYGSYGADHPYFIQGAVGLFKNKGNNIVTEWYTGVGTGNAEVTDSSDPGKLKGNYQLYFTQFNIGKLNSNFLRADYGLGLKAAYARSKFTDKDYFDIYSYKSTDFLYPIQNDNGFVLQPTVFGRFGKGRLKFNVKAGGLLYYQFTNRENKLPVGYFNLGLGLNYYINTKPFKRK
uniref:hypothetical protein n=1 Tax=uncultured Draconibacterium sp. TaxID=1573823 RepID=UPI00321775A3